MFIKRFEQEKDIAVLKETEIHWNKFIEENKVKEMEQYMHDDWILFSGDGNFTTKQLFLDAVANKSLVHTKMDFKFLQVRQYEHIGIVIQQGMSAGTWQGKAFNNREVATSIFLKDGQGWRSVLTMIAPEPAH